MIRLVISYFQKLARIKRLPVCHEKKFIFLHIPKCGGTSVERFFNLQRSECVFGVKEQGNKLLTLHHLTGPELLRFGLVESESVRDYFKFTIIRDPFDRMASDYLWQQRHDRYGIFCDLDFPSYLSFAKRIIEEQGFHKKRHFDHFRPMVDYCVHQNQLWVDEILLLDRLNTGLARLAPRLGQVNLDRANRGPDFESLRTSANVRQVYDLYEADKRLYDAISEIS